MRNKFIITILIALSLIVIIIINVTQSKRRTRDAKEFLIHVKEQNGNVFDSVNNKISKENELYSSVQEKIDQDSLKEALLLVNKLSDINRHKMHFYRGIIFEKQGNYQQALIEYSIAVKMTEYSVALTKRAALYEKLKLIDSSILDYKTLKEISFDYNLQIGRLFQLQNLKDSSLVYYSIYLQHYPENEEIKRRVQLLKN